MIINFSPPGPPRRYRPPARSRTGAPRQIPGART